ncbi:putative short-chain dehydrogenase [Ilyonectria robusta]|uniref:putative short-chain dehydrogenase n=1 Tax=Ilyonectria robusta TaxID=1079257 RepID=UPI001E8DC126|nr:putative short-chain dehydrogenase [Ilyonectria robusta]KAH8663748.1 putative short-chain dehydrogenase [Ilyonectria robusta]
MAGSENSLPFGFNFTKTVHTTPYPAISPSRAELSQKGKTVLITGGHTGIGWATARAFAQAGAEKIVIVARRENVVASAASRLASEFPSSKVIGYPCDIADLASVDQLWKKLAKDGTLIDVVVLNAAKVTVGPILDLTRDTAWSDYLLHVRSNLDFVQRLVKQPGAEGRPKVLINLTSIAIHENKMTGAYPNYSASKSAGTMLMQQVAKDVNPDELQIISFHPGGIFTELAEQSGFKKEEAQWDDENLPGQFAVWAASPEARFLHGRFVWAKWDVDELRGGPLRKRIDEDDEFLKVGVNGIQEWEKAGKTA